MEKNEGLAYLKVVCVRMYLEDSIQEAVEDRIAGKERDNWKKEIQIARPGRIVR